MINKVCVLLVASLIISEFHSIIAFLFPSCNIVERDLFLSPNYHNKITASWYIYELCEIASKTIWALVIFEIGNRISDKLAKVSIAFIWYYVSQSIFYMWNRNTSFFNNFCVYICMGVVIFLIFKPDRPQGKYRSF